ncbi:peptide-methionine (S)-S-oxide reductase [Mucilaginibacter conchicola]|uniref:Peptide methionine sulfoxide reductase MsrA n=1 Tax=Mucilaginibacter conchicola TaxID=2303333 RepID=A0A372NNF8_9SPHI|nr:peptide-methionine (S)-S-oxide reductase MsrA [Mucilaginibacter conchicola]RFZ90147.1 peptide-methionine (S)-S-oxide reductase [Mucilaginibacter conchicola]
MNIQKITFGSGCFWCTEAIFQSVKGVRRVTSGYTGGSTKNPTYMEICNGNTGHAEVVVVEYDADMVMLDELLLMFFKTHNPTSLNRQGGDIGTQYRSVIFYDSEEQKQQAEAMIKRLTDEQVFENPILTEISPAAEFYKAEDHHQNYYNDNPLKPYCAVVIQPKLNKFAKEFTDKIKPELL